MEYTTLNNGIKMPMAGIGTFLLTPDQAESAVLEALKDGYRLIDTANAYVNEKAVGREKVRNCKRRYFLRDKNLAIILYAGRCCRKNTGTTGYRLY